VAKRSRDAARRTAEIRGFLQEYARKAQRGREPNDRQYDRALEAQVKRMDPLELDSLINGVEDE